MNDREMLEWAAKAAGLNVGTDEGAYDDLKWWNPLIDDGDRYLLLKKLEMAIDFEAKEVIYCIKDVLYSEAFREDGDDARAVLRAAAEIGRNM